MALLNDEQKWEYLRNIPHADAEHPEIRLVADSLKTAANFHQRRLAQLIMTVARDWIKQTNDVALRGGEDIAGLTRQPSADDAIDALRRGDDDCDAKARLFVALATATGLLARMVGRWKPTLVTDRTPKGRTLTHVSAEVFLDGKWLPVELTLARARLGEMGEEVPKETKDNKWKLS